MGRDFFLCQLSSPLCYLVTLLSTSPSRGIAKTDLNNEATKKQRVRQVPIGGSSEFGLGCFVTLLLSTPYRRAAFTKIDLNNEGTKEQRVGQMPTGVDLNNEVTKEPRIQQVSIGVDLMVRRHHPFVTWLLCC